MTILASNFSGMAPLVCAVPVLILAAAVSFAPSWRGHWSGPVLAAPLALIVLLFILIQSTLDFDPLIWAILLLPLILAGASIVLWLVRRRRTSAS